MTRAVGSNLVSFFVVVVVVCNLVLTFLAAFRVNNVLKVGVF